MCPTAYWPVVSGLMFTLLLTVHTLRVVTSLIRVCVIMSVFCLPADSLEVAISSSFSPSAGCFSRRRSPTHNHGGATDTAYTHREDQHFENDAGEGWDGGEVEGWGEGEGEGWDEGEEWDEGEGEERCVG